MTSIAKDKEVMNESFKEKLVEYFRRTMKRHPYLKGLITVGLFFALAFYYIVNMICSNTKRLVSLAVLIVFYTISCSFCAPVFQSTAVEEEVIWTEHLADEDISLATEEEVEQVTEEVVEESIILESTNPEVVDDEVIIDYSVDEILEQHKNNQLNLETEEEENDSVSEEDEWKLILVNKQHPIPDDYEFALGTITGNLKCDERIIPELLEMLQAAKDDGISLIICSPYRPLERQQYLFNRKITNYMNRGMSYMEAYKLASQAVTVPNTSEHQLGLALDIYTSSYMSLDFGFGETKAGIWLRENCSKYGFILRYPKGKEYITGIEYEPWHFRYVGKEAATQIMEQGICLEEYHEIY
ncbi:MAG: D-alanyl-D-alanine carboxypeptidase family protein [Lachnospiraceae bacterium]|nr:D-alanyl-D-alanine carboxypeptidase family protein [Lachnospiraceae bacterium]